MAADGHLGMTALSRITLALAGRSCTAIVSSAVARHRSLVSGHLVSGSDVLLFLSGQEYETFKKHSQSLLQQEKELNERLRHLVI